MGESAQAGQSLLSGNILFQPVDQLRNMIAERYLFLLWNLNCSVPELTGDAKIAVTRSKPQLRDRLNEALKEIRSNGMLEKINTRHIPFRVI